MAESTIDFIAKYLLHDLNASLKKPLDELLLPAGYEPPQNFLDLGPVTYLRHRKDGKIDCLLKDHNLNNHFNEAEERSRLAYLCFNDKKDHETFLDMRKELGKFENREGITHRGMGLVDVNPQTYTSGTSFFYGLGAGALGFTIPTLILSYPRESLDLFERGIALASGLACGLVGAVVGHYLAKRKVKILQEQRSAVIGEYNTTYNSFKDQYGSRISYDKEALEKALQFSEK